MVPVVGLEPTSLRRATDFKSVVFANFTTLALIKDKFEIKCKFLLLSKTWSNGTIRDAESISKQEANKPKVIAAIAKGTSNPPHKGVVWEGERDGIDYTK